MADYNQQYILDRIEKTANGCWIWQAAKDRLGYGQVRREGCGESLAHRLAYKVFVGVPDGLVIRHVCDNSSCVNPEHLLAGTQADNLADMRRRGRAYYHPRGLTDEQVREIEEHLQSPYRGQQFQLARQYNVAPSVITKVKQGRYT